MKMKKVKVMLSVMALGIMLTACGQKEEASAPEVEVGTEAEAEAVAEDILNEIENVTEESAEEAPAEEPAEEVPVEEETVTEEAPETPAEDTAAEGQSTDGYADNFAVDSAAAAEFAGKIQAAVAAQDLEALADLASYPLYVGLTDGSVDAKSKEEFMALGAERIFTPELTESVTGADVSALQPSMAGFSISKDGKPNIIFGVTDGTLGIKGINY